VELQDLDHGYGSGAHPYLTLGIANGNAWNWCAHVSLTERFHFSRQRESGATDSPEAPSQFHPFPESSSSGSQELYGQ